MKTDNPTTARGRKGKITAWILGGLMIFAGMASAEEKIRVAGSGSMISLLNDLAKAYMTENKNVLIEINQTSIESTGGIKSAAAGQVEIGMASRMLKDDEKTLGVQATEISRVGTVIGVNRSVTVKEITSEQLCRIYSGAITNWSELGGAPANVLPLTRPDADATKETVRKSIACFRDLREPASVIVAPKAPDMTKLLANKAGSVGFTDSVAVDDSAGSVIALKLDGVAATVENVRSGKYRIIKSNYLITKGQPSGAAKEFIDFIRGPKGARIIEANKAVPVR